MARNGECGWIKEIAKEALQDTLVMGVSFHLYEYLLLFNLARVLNHQFAGRNPSSNWLEDIETRLPAQGDSRDN